MKKEKITNIIIATLISAISLTVGYGIGRNSITISKDSVEVRGNMEGKKSTETNEKAELTLWTFYGGWEEAANSFNEKNDNIKVSVEQIPHDKYLNTYLTALAAEKAPNLLVIDSNQFGAFNTTEALEDLLQKPYSVGDYKKDLSESIWKIGSSFDQKRMLGVPMDSSPMITLYRADIMEQYGFPSEPDKLREYMSNPNNWLEIAQTLKKDDKKILQWSSDIIKNFETNTPLFDEKLNFLRDNKEFYAALDLSKKARKDGLELKGDIWGDSGKKALKEDRLAMLYMASWGVDLIKGLVPEQSGKWRITGLPFGINGFSNSSIISINSSSKNKEAAWSFIKYSVFDTNRLAVGGSVPSYLPARNNPNIAVKGDEFLGWQRTDKVFIKLVSEMKEQVNTPITEKANKIWTENVYAGLDADKDSKQIIQDVIESINKELGKDKELLLK